MLWAIAIYAACVHFLAMSERLAPAFDPRCDGPREIDNQVAQLSVVALFPFSVAIYAAYANPNASVAPQVVLSVLCGLICACAYYILLRIALALRDDASGSAIDRTLGMARRWLEPKMIYLEFSAFILLLGEALRS